MVACTAREPRGALQAVTAAVALVATVAGGGCSFDWDALDPALGGAGPTTTSQGGHSTSNGGTTPTGGSAGAGGSGAAGGSSDWFDPAFTRRRQLQLATPGEDLQDVPVMVKLDASRIDYGAVQSGGEDLRFVAADQAVVLSHEIEVFDPNGTSVVWVEVPLIAAGSGPDHFWMYYGNPQASDGQDPAGTWSNGYVAVWHLHAGFADSTPNGNDGTSSGAVNAPGQAGYGAQFNGIADYVHIGTAASVANVFAGGGTLSAWIVPDTWGVSNFGRVLDKSVTSSAGQGWAFQIQDAFWSPQRCVRFERRFDAGLGVWETPTDSIVLDVGQHVVIAYDEDAAANVPDIYIDGELESLDPNQPTGTAVSDTSSPLRIGNRGNDVNRAFHGVIDEVRMASVMRSGPWVAAQVQSLTDTLITYGAEQTVP